MSSTLKKPRASEWLELTLLVLGGLVVLYFACRTREPEAASEARAGKIFTADRAAPVGGASDTLAAGDAEARLAAVEQAVRELISGVAMGSVDETRRAEAQLALVALLERLRWGTPPNRATAAAVVVQMVFDRAKLENRSAALSMQQVRAIQGVSKELARELLLLAIGVPPGADAISEPLPAGHARVTWNQLGGFAYQEGAELPQEVQALGGRNVAIVGFMLTLGSSEQLTEFVLVESLWGCCFGSVPDVHQTIVVRLRPGSNADYSAAPLLVSGRLEAGEEREGGFVTSVYRIVDAAVRPLELAAPR
jgi:hypothetical protein